MSWARILVSAGRMVALAACAAFFAWVMMPVLSLKVEGVDGNEFTAFLVVAGVIFWFLRVTDRIPK